jgi:hypothetical protein
MMAFSPVPLFLDNREGFVPGLTLTCFLYMQDSKAKHGLEKKFELATPIIADILEYLKFLDKVQEKKYRKKFKNKKYLEGI